MRFVSWSVALAIILATVPSALAQKKPTKPSPKPTHSQAPKPKPKPAKPAAPKPVHKPAPKPEQQKPAPKPAKKPATSPKPKPKPTQVAKPAPRPNVSAAQKRQAEAARAAAKIRAGQAPRSGRPSGSNPAKVPVAGRSATPSRLIPSAGKLITPTTNGLAAAPLITPTPIPALNGLARAPRITPSAVKTNSMMVQNSRKEVVVVGRNRGGRYAGRGYGHRSYGHRYGGRSYRSYSRFRRPYRNPNAASQALALQRLEQLRIDLDQIRQSRALPAETLRTRLGDDLMAIAQNRPSASEAGAIRLLADDLCLAVRGHPGVIPPTDDLVVALNQVVNHRRMAPGIVESSIRDGRMVLQAWRVPLSKVSKVIQDLRAVSGTSPVAAASLAP